MHACSGIDLNDVNRLGDKENDLDIVLLDAMIEGFDTGVSWFSQGAAGSIFLLQTLNPRLTRQGMLYPWVSCLTKCGRQVDVAC